MKNCIHSETCNKTQHDIIKRVGSSAIKTFVGCCNNSPCIVLRSRVRQTRTPSPRLSIYPSDIWLMVWCEQSPPGNLLWSQFLVQ